MKTLTLSWSDVTDGDVYLIFIHSIFYLILASLIEYVYTLLCYIFGTAIGSVRPDEILIGFCANKTNLADNNFTTSYYTKWNAKHRKRWLYGHVCTTKCGDVLGCERHLRVCIGGPHALWHFLTLAIYHKMPLKPNLSSHSFGLKLRVSTI